MDIDPAIESAVQHLMVCAPPSCPREIDCMRIGIWARDVIRYQRDVTPLTRSAMIGLWAWARANPDATFEDFLAASERAIAVSGGA